ncbi:MAG: acyltransferase family protein [Deltaproteobacteria bacterium]|nr:acyltransferase family protein [Deltaproteobacteria bacterium]
MVPLASRPPTPTGLGPLRSVLAGVGDAFVRLAEDLAGEDLDTRIRAIRLHPNEVGFDPFGFDPAATRYALAVAALLHRRYFRTKVRGAENIPDGRVMLVSNHSGQIPLDGVVIGAAMMLDAEPPRFPRSMVEKWTAELPLISVFFPRVGQVLGSPANARRLLEQGEALLVFPEGSRGISKTFDKRYQLSEFGLGFMRLALETNTPIVPISVVGAEEQYVSLGNIAPLAKLLGMPAFPIIPQLFFGMLAPLPTRYHIRFGEPLRFEGDPDDDDAIVGDMVWQVKARVQAMVNDGLASREGIFR